MPYPDTAEGFTIADHNKWTDFGKTEFPLKTFDEHSVDIAIDACGVCGSDIHTISGGWGDAPLPLCVGHEVIGRVLRVGDKVTTCKKGDRVGVGAQIGACLKCDNCKNHQENYCDKMIDTYGGFYDNGVKSMGGYASHMRSHEYFTFPIPDGIESEQAAPLLCAGITVYSPLVRLGCGPGKHIAVVGLGGLGHYAVLFAKAMGAKVTVISHSSSKKDDAAKLGADNFIATGEEGWHKPYRWAFDFIVNASNATDRFNLDEYFSTLKVGGNFHCVGLPENPLPAFKISLLLTGFHQLSSSHIGNREEMLDMLKLVADKQIKGWVQTIDISKEGCAQAVEGVQNGKPRFRYTLVNFDDAFGKRA